MRTFHPTMTWRPHLPAVKQLQHLYCRKREIELAAVPRGRMVAGSMKVYGTFQVKTLESGSIGEACLDKNTNKIITQTL